MKALPLLLFGVTLAGLSAAIGSFGAPVDTTPPVITGAPDKTVECGTGWNFDVPTATDECVFDALVFDNSINDLQVRFNPGPMEVGDEIILDGLARDVSSFIFEYYGTNTAQAGFAGTVQARVRFYKSDGPLLNGYPTPGTVLYDSGPFGLIPTARSTVTITDFVTDAVVPLTNAVPDSFTWAVQFSGLGSGDEAGLDLYSPPTVGQDYVDYWERTTDGWKLKTNAVSVDFAARLLAANRKVVVTEVGTVTNKLCGRTYRATRTWQATDACGNSTNASQMVTVLDTTPPAVVCPKDIVIDSTSATGVVVSFTASATDRCSDVTVACIPPSGGLFPVGTTNVVCAATDACGNSAACQFTVTVLGARSMLEQVRIDLLALSSSVTNHEDSNKLKEAIEQMTEALAPKLWRDQNHVQFKDGEKVFNEVKEVVHTLEELIRSKKGQMLGAVWQGFLDRIVKAERLLAIVSLQDMINAGANARKLAEANRELAKGDEEIAKGNFEAGLQHYRNAWKQAVHLHIGNIRKTDHHVQLAVVGVPGQSCVVQASTNLVDWVTVGTCTATADGSMVFDDPEAGNVPSRFYRVVTP